MRKEKKKRRRRRKMWQTWATACTILEASFCFNETAAAQIVYEAYTIIKRKILRISKFKKKKKKNVWYLR